MLEYIIFMKYYDNMNNIKNADIQIDCLQTNHCELNCIIPTLLQGFYQPYFMAFFRIFHITIITEYPLEKESINYCSTILVRT